MNWESTLATDYDSDGCQDLTGDIDDDNDGVEDLFENCPMGELDWISDPVLDYDGDGCRDATEDLDDDNDGVTDLEDSCQKGDLDWQSYNVTDSDADGCQDLTEDLDYDTPEPEESGIECNPFVTTCNETASDEIEPQATNDEGEVQSLILGLLAMALVPTILGGLLIAYRIRW